MLKSLLFKNLLGLAASILFCSFVVYQLPDMDKLGANELSYEEGTVSLKFGGYEAFGDGHCFSSGNHHYMSDIYLADVDLNNSTTKTPSKIVLQLSNYMASDKFIEGNFDVKAENYLPKGQNENVVYARMYESDGEKIEIVSGKVKYMGQLPDILIEFDLKLNNGKHIKGNYNKSLSDFKYFF